jgi:energy-coupling factor transporter ATP-binding protein EcfA2
MKHYFGFTKEPFSPDIKVEELYHTAALEGTKERILYAVNLGAISVITGDVGSGKSTALRYASAALHPSRCRIIPVIASTGSVYVLLELAKKLDLDTIIYSRPGEQWVKDVLAMIAGRVIYAGSKLSLSNISNDSAL